MSIVYFSSSRPMHVSFLTSEKVPLEKGKVTVTYKNDLPNFLGFNGHEYCGSLEEVDDAANHITPWNGSRRLLENLLKSNHPIPYPGSGVIVSVLGLTFGMPWSVRGGLMSGSAEGKLDWTKTDVTARYCFGPEVKLIDAIVEVTPLDS